MVRLLVALGEIRSLQGANSTREQKYSRLQMSEDGTVAKCERRVLKSREESVAAHFCDLPRVAAATVRAVKRSSTFHQNSTPQRFVTMRPSHRGLVHEILSIPGALFQCISVP